MSLSDYTQASLGGRYPTRSPGNQDHFYPGGGPNRQPNPDRKRIEADIDKYIANGGTITVLPPDANATKTYVYQGWTRESMADLLKTDKPKENFS